MKEIRDHGQVWELRKENVAERTAPLRTTISR
jgi:hypothetical protein